MAELTPERVHEWIDTDLVEGVDPVTDDHAVFNFLVQMSGVFVHVVRREPGGPLIVGQDLEFDDRIRERIAGMDPAKRGELLGRVREALMAEPVVYGFQNERGESVAFEEVHHVFVERRIYPDAAAESTLMDALVGVWKAIRYLDDVWSLMDAIEGTSPDV
jgi:hypothetical protein